MMTVNLKINHLGINVKKLEEAIDFYQNSLGYRLLEKHDQIEGPVKLAFLDLGGQVIELLEHVDNDNLHHAFDHLAFTVTDLKTAIEKLKKQGLKPLSHEPKEVLSGAKIFFFEGPNGEKFELFQPSMSNL